MRKTVIILAAVMISGILIAEGPNVPKPAAPVAAAGILTDAAGDAVTIWVDGEDAPAKFAYAETFDKKTVKGIFNISRVQFTYSKADDVRKLVTIKKEAPKPAGVVTGVVQFSNDFWVAVKPKVGPMDGYAIGAPGEMGNRLKALNKGDTVTIRFHTDFERHRIDALAVAPPTPVVEPGVKPPAPAARPVPTSAPAAAAASQPADSPEVLAGSKLKLAQLYIDSGMKAQATETLQAIIKLYPDTESARQAKAMLAKLGE